MKKAVILSRAGFINDPDLKMVTVEVEDDVSWEEVRINIRTKPGWEEAIVAPV